MPYPVIKNIPMNAASDISISINDINQTNPVIQTKWVTAANI